MSEEHESAAESVRPAKLVDPSSPKRVDTGGFRSQDDKEKDDKKKPIKNVHVVTVSGFMFSPDNMIICLGDSIKWCFKDSGHSVVDNEGQFDSGVINDDEDFTYTYETPGVFPYHCGQMPNMVGKVIVRK